MTTQKIAISLTLDTYQEIYVERKGEELVPVLHQSIFLENSEEALLSQETPLEKVLDKFIDMNTVPNGTITEDQRKDLLKQMYSILNVVEQKVKLIEELPEWTPEDN